MSILDTKLNLTLRPMAYPQLFKMYRDSIKNSWTVPEVDFSADPADLDSARITPAMRHMIHRLVAFFATGDTIVANNVVIGLYRVINAPEARMFLLRQGYEEALHIDFYLTLLDTYVPDLKEREAAFKAVETIPSIKLKADFCARHTRLLEQELDQPQMNVSKLRRELLQNIIAYTCCVEGLFFFGAFAYVYYLKSLGLLQGLAAGTNWVFRDECLAAGTEVLTPDGWKTIETITKKDRVAQFDMETSEVSFVHPLRTVRNDVDEDLIEFSNQKGGIHQLVTKNHEVVQKWEYQPTYSKQTAGEFKPNGKKLIPVSGFKQGAKEHLTPLERFLIALQADGHIPSRYTGEICGTVPARFELKRPRKLKRMRRLLKDLAPQGFTWSESPSSEGRTCFTVNAPVAVIQLTKFLRDWVKLEDVSSSWGTAFLEEVGYWDGHRPKTKANGHFIYYSSVEASNVDVIQAVAALCGRHVSRSTQVKKKSETEDYRTIHRAWIHDTTTVRGGKTLHRSEVPYRGTVHCVTVPTGAILIRSRGKVSITGNCSHMEFGFEILRIAREEYPELFDAEMEAYARATLNEALSAEAQFAEDLLGGGVAGLSMNDMKTYLQYVVDQRLKQLGYAPTYRVKNPLPFMVMQDVQEHTNFFERRVTAYQVGVEGSVPTEFDDDY